MYTEIPSLTRCCFCAPLRYGLLVWVYLKLVFNMLVFGTGLIKLSAFAIFLIFFEYAIYILMLFISMMLLLLSDIIFSIVLIVGIHKKHTTLLHLYLRFGIAHTALFVAVFLMIITFLLFTATEIHRDETLRTAVVFITISTSFTILQTYLLLLVRSEMLKLKTNGQFQFTNHTSDPRCVMQTDVSSTGKEKEILT